MPTLSDNSIENNVEDGIDYLIGLFKAAGQQQWPRTISTKLSCGRQEVVYSREQALSYFRSSCYVDCRINGYPKYTEYQGIQRHAPNFLFVADLDKKHFKSKDLFNKTYNKILKNVAEVLNGASPAVIWSGNGYHMLLPTKISEPLEAESIFIKYTNTPSRDFLRFAERYLSMGKSDKQHYTIVSFKTYLTRVPGSLNSKCISNGLSEKDSQAKLVQEWNGVMSTIKGKLLREFYKDLVDRYVKEKKEKSKSSAKLQRYYHHQHQKSGQGDKKAPLSWGFSSFWMEKLLQTPIPDWRQSAIELILSRYLVNVKRLSFEESYAIIKGWLDRCSRVAPLQRGVNYDNIIRSELQNAIKSGRLPMSKNHVKEMLPELYQILFSHFTGN